MKKETEQINKLSKKDLKYFQLWVEEEIKYWKDLIQTIKRESRERRK